MSKISSKFEELAIVSAKATITDGTLFDSYFRCCVCRETDRLERDCLYPRRKSGAARQYFVD